MPAAYSAEAVLGAAGTTIGCKRCEAVAFWRMRESPHEGDRMQADAFAQWIEAELAQRGWKPSDLAREAGINQGTLSNVLNGVRGAGLDFCTRVAEALRLPPEFVLRQACLLPPTTESSPRAVEMAHLFDQLPLADQERAVAIARALLRAADTGSRAGAADQPYLSPAMAESSSEDLTDAGSPPAAAQVAEPGVPGARSRWRRAVVYVLGGILLIALVGVVIAGFVEGSWWYTYSSDRALDTAARARLQNVRDDLGEGDLAPEAAVWLDAALAPRAHPTDVRLYLLTAREIIQSTGDPGAPDLVGQLDQVLGAIQTQPEATSGVPTLVPISTPG